MTNDHNDRVLMGFNVEELRRVADCLRILNPARAPNVDGTMRYIAQYARTHLNAHTEYVETMGFCVTAYHDHTGRLLYKVTLSSYGVAEYIAGVQRANELHATEYGKLHAKVRAYEALTPEMREAIAAVIKVGEGNPRKKDLEP